jgi:ubiquinone/menaquinone biosynthesis C-methylase UbiE
VTGIDVMAKEVEIARKLAADEDLRSVEFHLMDAMQRGFPDASFDLVVGGAAPHQLQLDRALPGIARVLTSDGRAMFHEPLGHNPAINRYRRRTAELRASNEGLYG